MGKVWVVSHGEYSDWRIVGIFDDRDLAVRFKDLVGAENDLEEHDLNPNRADVDRGLAIFSVRMFRDGAVDESSGKTEPDDEGPESRFAEDRDDTVHREHEYGVPFIGNRFTGRTFIDQLVLARDLEHAVKIVNDRRRQLIAEGKWPEPPPPPTFQELMAKARDLAAEDRARLGQEPGGSEPRA